MPPNVLKRLRPRGPDLELQEQGERLTRAHQQLKDAEQQLADAKAEREQADATVRRLAESEIVTKFLCAYNNAIAMNYGHSWSMYAAWLVTTLPRACAPQPALYLLGADCPEELRFSEDDRAKLRDWATPKDRAETCLHKCDGLASRMALILKEHPELQSAS